MKKTKSVAIIGEGETEWFYFESLRTTRRYPFKVQPGFPQHADISHFIKMAESYARDNYDYVICLIDMDRLRSNPTEMGIYLKAKSEYAKKNRIIRFVETYPCTELWFLLHFLPVGTVRKYNSCDELLPELRRYIPGYEKSKKYLKRADLYRYLSQNGNLEVAKQNAAKLCELSKNNPEDNIAYSEIHKVFELLDKLNPLK